MTRKRFPEFSALEVERGSSCLGVSGCELGSIYVMYRRLCCVVFPDHRWLTFSLPFSRVCTR